MKIINSLLIFSILLSFLFTIYQGRLNYQFKFEPEKYRSLYERSQFAPDSGKRTTYISDWDLYAYAGLLYIHGVDPSSINFEHPPLAKYIIGLSSLFLGNPNMFQILAGIAFLLSFFVLANLFLKNITISLLLVLLLSIEGLFKQQIQFSLLDIWQTLFLNIGLIALSKLKSNKNWWILMIISIVGIAASKFFITGILFALFVLLDLLFQKDSANIKKYLFYTPIILFLFIIIYLPYFQNHTFIDFINLEYRTIKFFKSYVPEYPWGEVWRMLLNGDWQTWWGNKGIIKTEYFNPLWPILEFNFLATVIFSFNKAIKNLSLPFLWSIIYLTFTSVHLLFPHYLLLALPSLYILLGWNIERGIIYAHRHRWI